MAEQTAKPADTLAETMRTEILRHAHDLFCHYGFNKTNIGDIANCCGMSPGNLYRYYRNKQGIGLAVVQQYFAQSETAMETVLMLPEGTAEERLRAFLKTGIGHILAELDRNPKIVELAEFLCDSGNDEGWELLNAHLQWRRTRVALQAGQRCLALLGLQRVLVDPLQRRRSR